jgi:hypothetical protein
MRSGPGPYRSAPTDRATRRGAGGTRDVQGAVVMVLLIALPVVGLVGGRPSRGVAVIVLLGVILLLLGGGRRPSDG